MATDVRAVLIKLIGKNETKKAFTSINKSLNGLKAGIKQMGAFTVATGAGAGAIAKFGADFSLKMAEVSTIADNSKISMAQLQKEILLLSSESGKAPVELAEALYQTLSAGVATADAMAFLGKSTKAAIGGVATTTEAVDLATNAMNAFGKEFLKTDRIFDVTFQTVKLGKTTMSELAESMGILFQPAAKIGLSFEDINAAIATLTKGGVKTSVAVTQLRSVMVSLLKPTADAQDAAKELGIEFTAGALKAKGLQGFLKEVQQATIGNDEAIARLFPNVRGMAAVFSLAGKQSGEFKDILGQLKNATGAADGAFNLISKDAGFKFNKMLNELSISATKLGMVLLPVINEIVTVSTAWLKENDELARTVGVLVGALVLLNLSGIAPVIFNLGMLTTTMIATAVTAVPSLIAQFTALQLITLSTSGALWAMAAPMLLVGGYIVAVGVAGYAAGRGIAALLEHFAPETWNAVVSSIEKVGKALGFFDRALTEDDLAIKKEEMQKRADAIIAKQREEKNNTPDENGTLDESKVAGQKTGAQVKMFVKENNDAMTEGILAELRNTNTQMSGAITAGGNGI